MDRELLAQYARLEVEPFADDLLEREETRQLVNTTMSQLPPHYRDALEAKYLRGKSVRDLATLWSISEKAVESLLTRAGLDHREIGRTPDRKRYDVKDNKAGQIKLPDQPL